MKVSVRQVALAANQAHRILTKRPISSPKPSRHQKRTSSHVSITVSPITAAPNRFSAPIEGTAPNAPASDHNNGWLAHNTFCGPTKSITTGDPESAASAVVFSPGTAKSPPNTAPSANATNPNPSAHSTARSR